MPSSSFDLIRTLSTELLMLSSLSLYLLTRKLFFFLRLHASISGEKPFLPPLSLDLW